MYTQTGSSDFYTVSSIILDLVSAVTKMATEASNLLTLKLSKSWQFCLKQLRLHMLECEYVEVNFDNFFSLNDSAYTLVLTPKNIFLESIQLL